MFQFASLIVVSNSKQTGSLQEVVSVGTVVLILGAQIFNFGFKQGGCLLGVDQRLAMVTLLVLNSAQVELVEWILVRNLLKIKLGLINLP
jgi:hypothetical protein